MRFVFQRHSNKTYCFPWGQSLRACYTSEFNNRKKKLEKNYLLDASWHSKLIYGGFKVHDLITSISMIEAATFFVLHNNLIDKSSTLRHIKHTKDVTKKQLTKKIETMFSRKQ